MIYVFFKEVLVILLNDIIIKKRLMYLLELNNKYLENLEYQISLKEKTYKNSKKIPAFTGLIRKFDKSVVNLEGKFEKIHLRNSFQIIISELDNLMKQPR